MRNPVSQRQFLEMQVMHFKVVGASVTTSDGVSTGLSIGQHLATIKKGTGASSNLVTITLKSPLGMIPGVLLTERTLDCEARLETDPTVSVIQVRTMKLDGVTKADDANFEMTLIGTEGVREGKY